MEKEELAKTVGEAISESFGKLNEAVGNFLQRTAPKPEEENEDPNSPETLSSRSTQQWLDDKRTGGLGGKDLSGHSSHTWRRIKQTDSIINSGIARP